MLFHPYEDFDDITVSTFWKRERMTFGLEDRMYMFY
jgi:hypothetical protein